LLLRWRLLGVLQGNKQLLESREQQSNASLELGQIFVCTLVGWSLGKLAFEVAFTK
jgi:hypothetical protein